MVPFQLSAAIQSASAGVMHFPEVLPWLDLFYYRDKSSSVSLNEKQISSAIDELVSQAIMEFGMGDDFWIHSLNGHHLILRRST